MILYHEFEASLLTQATLNANSSDPEEISSKMFELKKATSYYAYLKHKGEDYKCENAHLNTIMIAETYENDDKLYKRFEGDALISDCKNDSRLYYRNTFKLDMFKLPLNSKWYENSLASRRMTTMPDTRVIVSAGNNSVVDTLTIFFNSTKTRQAKIKCHDQINIQNFKSGSSMELPIFCSVKSHWFNVSKISVHSDGEKRLTMDNFNVDWKPLITDDMSSNQVKTFKETVEKFIQLRDQSIREGARLRPSDIFQKIGEQ